MNVQSIPLVVFVAAVLLAFALPHSPAQHFAAVVKQRRRRLL